MKVAREVREKGAHQRAEGAGVDEGMAEQPPPLAHREEGAALRHEDHLLQYHEVPEEERGDDHDPATLEVGAADRAVEVEGHAAVLVLFGRVPAPQLRHRGVGALQEFVVGEHELAHQGGEVLERAGDGELATGAQELLRDAQAELHQGLELRHRDALRGEVLVVGDVLAAVVALLRAEREALVLQRAVDLREVVLHAPDEEALAHGEEDRQLVPVRGDGEAIAVPVTRYGPERKAEVAHFDGRHGMQSARDEAGVQPAWMERGFSSVFAAPCESRAAPRCGAQGDAVTRLRDRSRGTRAGLQARHQN